MSVVSVSNINMIHDLMINIIQDNNLKNVNELRNFIESKCAYFHTNRYEFGSLNEINKKIVELSYNFIMSNQPRVNSTNSINKNNFNDNMTKKSMFDKNLELQQKSFNTMINPKKPKEIDFSDSSEDFPIENLDKIMNQTLADRQRELEQITQQYSEQDKVKAQSWLNTSAETTTPKIKIDNTSNLKLDNTINMNSEKYNSEKRVRFNISDVERNSRIDNQNTENKKQSLTNLFNKLKRKDITSTESNLSIKPKIKSIDDLNIKAEDNEINKSNTPMELDTNVELNKNIENIILNQKKILSTQQLILNKLEIVDKLEILDKLEISDVFKCMLEKVQNTKELSYSPVSDHNTLSYSDMDNEIPEFSAI